MNNGRVLVSPAPAPTPAKMSFLHKFANVDVLLIVFVVNMIAFPKKVTHQ